MLVEGWKSLAFQVVVKLEFDYKHALISLPGNKFCSEGSWITINGSSGIVYYGKGIIGSPKWHQSPELSMFAKLIERAIASNEVNHETIGTIWRIWDFFVHSIPLNRSKSTKKPVSRRSYKSFVQPLKKNLLNARKILSQVEPELRENYSNIVMGLSEALSRLLASTIGIGNHHKYFRPLWDPETTISQNNDKELTQFVGFDFF